MPRYSIRGTLWSFTGTRLRVLDEDERLVMCVQQPMWRVRDELVVYADERTQQPLLRLRSREVVALDHTYDVTDAQTGERLGAVVTKGVSFVRERFLILEAGGAEVGYAEQVGASVLRRLLPLFGSEHAVVVGGRPVAHIRRFARLFAPEYSVTIDDAAPLPERFLLAACLLVLVVHTRRTTA